MTGNAENNVHDEVHDEGQLRAYLDGELAKSEVAQVEVHLESCGECRDRLDDLRRGAVEVSTLLAMPVHAPDSHAALSNLRKALGDEAASRNRVSEGVVQEIAPGAGWSREKLFDAPRLRRSRIALSGIGVMLAAALVLGLGLFWSGLPGRVPDKAPVLGLPSSPGAATATAGDASPTVDTMMSGLRPERDLIGLAAPDAELLDLADGQTVKLSSFRGKVVVLSFWDTRCPPCRDILPVLKKVYDRAGQVGDVEFISVTFSYPGRDTPAGVKEFLSDKPYKWHFLHDTGSDVVKQFHVDVVPLTFVIDRFGIVRAVEVGSTPQNGDLQAQKLSDAIEGALTRP